MLNEAYYEQDWIAQPAPVRPHMETNQWLANVCTTRSPRARAATETETFELLGLKLIWTKDRGRGFPKPIIDALQKLIEFAELETDWDSHSGGPLQKAAGQTVIQAIIVGHQFAKLPRLYPLGDGGVGLVWEGDRELELLVAGDGTVEGIMTVGGDETELEAGSSPTIGLELLERYLTNR